MFSVKQHSGVYEPAESSAHTVALDELTPAKAHADTAPTAVDAIGTEEVNACRLQC